MVAAIVGMLHLWEAREATGTIIYPIQGVMRRADDLVTAVLMAEWIPIPSGHQTTPRSIYAFHP